MRKIMVVGTSESIESPAVTIDQLSSEVQLLVGEDARVSATYLDQLVLSAGMRDLSIFDPASGSNLLDYDLVMLRGPKMRAYSELAYSVSKMCNLSGIALLNDFSMYYAGTKYMQALVFKELSLPFLRTIYSRDFTTLVAWAEKELKYPYILKDNMGSHGEANFLIESREDAMDARHSTPTCDYIAQEYCPNDRDYRILLVGDKELVFERKGDSSSHLNNTSKGGTAKSADQALPLNILRDARYLAKYLKLGIAGIDVMPDLARRNFYFLEINSQPQLLTGAMLSSKRTLLKEYIGQIIAKNID